MLLLAHHLAHTVGTVRLEGLPRVLAGTGAIVGGRYTSHRGLTANRLITSSAAAAFASGTVTRPRSRVSITRRPATSSRASRSAGGGTVVLAGAAAGPWRVAGSRSALGRGPAPWPPYPVPRGRAGW